MKRQFIGTPSTFIKCHHRRIEASDLLCYEEEEEEEEESTNSTEGTSPIMMMNAPTFVIVSTWMNRLDTVVPLPPPMPMPVFL